MFYCIDNCFVEFGWIFFFLLKWDFCTTKKDGSTGPSALESYGPYFEIMGQWPRPTINLKAWITISDHKIRVQNFHVSQSRRLLRLLKRTVSMRRFFWLPKTNLKTDGYWNNTHNADFLKKIWTVRNIGIMTFSCVSCTWPTYLRLLSWLFTCFSRPL